MALQDIIYSAENKYKCRVQVNDISLEPGHYIRGCVSAYTFIDSYTGGDEVARFQFAVMESPMKTAVQVWAKRLDENTSRIPISNFLIVFLLSFLDSDKIGMLI